MTATKRRLVKQWNALKPATRNRYVNTFSALGLDPRSYYLSGANLSAGRGHINTPEHPGRSTAIRFAETHAINHYLPKDQWDALPVSERRQIAEWYKLRFFTKGQGANLTKAERHARGIKPSDKHTFRHFSQDQNEAEVFFMQKMVELNGTDWDTEDWSYYRTDAYYSTFSEAA